MVFAADDLEVLEVLASSDELLPKLAARLGAPLAAAPAVPAPHPQPATLPAMPSPPPAAEAAATAEGVAAGHSNRADAGRDSAAAEVERAVSGNYMHSSQPLGSAGRGCAHAEETLQSREDEGCSMVGGRGTAAEAALLDVQHGREAVDGLHASQLVASPSGAEEVQAAALPSADVECPCADICAVVVASAEDRAACVADLGRVPGPSCSTAQTVTSGGLEADFVEKAGKLPDRLHQLAPAGPAVIGADGALCNPEVPGKALPIGG